MPRFHDATKLSADKAKCSGVFHTTVHLVLQNIKLQLGEIAITLFLLLCDTGLVANTSQENHVECV